MARGRINWPVIIVAVMAVIIVAGSAVGLRAWNRANRMKQGKSLGLAAYEKQDWPAAASNLGLYLGVKQGTQTSAPDYPEYQDILYKYAQANLKTRPQPNGSQAVNSYRTILQGNWSQLNEDGRALYLKAANELVDIYLSSQQTCSEASDTCQRVFKAVKGSDVDIADLREKNALALILQQKNEQAAQVAQELIKFKPDQVGAYNIMAQAASALADTPSAKITAALKWLDLGVTRNPQSPLARMARSAFYQNIARNPANRQNAANFLNLALQDALKALELKPQDPQQKIQLAMRLNALYLPDNPERATLRQQAESLLAEVQAQDPLLIQLWVSRLSLYNASGQEQQAAQIADEALAALTWQKIDFYPQAIETYIKADQLEKAQKLVEEIRQAEINDRGVAFWQGWIALKRNQFQVARESFERAYGLGLKTVRLRLFMAQLYDRIGDLLTAEQHLRRLVADNPQSDSLRIELARLLMRRGNYLDAEIHAREALRIRPSTEAVYLNTQARLRRIQSQPDQPDQLTWRTVKDDVNRLAETAPEAAGVKLMQFRVAMQEKRFDAAQSILDQVLQNEPDNLSAQIAQVELLVEQQQDAAVVDHLQQLIEKYPDETSPVTILVRAYLKNNQTDKAIDVLTDAMTRFSNPAQKRDLALELSAIYEQNNQRDQARQLLQTVDSELKEDIAVKRRRLIYFYIDLEENISKQQDAQRQQLTEPLARLEQQEKDLRQQAQRIIDQIQAVEGKETGWQYRLEQARLWMIGENSFTQQQADIERVLQDNLKNNPNDLDSRQLLARASERAGKTRQALNLFQELYSRRPADLSLKMDLARLNLALGNREVANEFITMIKTADKNAPQGRGLTDTQRARLLQLEKVLAYQKGELDAAESILARFIKENPGNISNRLEMASLKIQNGQYDQAAQLLQAIRQENPDLYPAAVMEIRLQISQFSQQTDPASQKPFMDKALKLADALVDQFAQTNVDAWLIRSQVHVANNDLDAARADLNQAQTQAPDNADVWYRLSLFYEIEEKPTQAIAACQKAYDLLPDNPELARRLTALHFTSGSTELRAKAANQLLPAFLKKFPDNTGLKFLLVAQLAQGNNPRSLAQAEQILQQMVADEPMNGQAWSLLIDRALATQQYARAVTLADKALTHFPQNTTFLIKKAQALEMDTALADNTDALTQLQQLSTSNIQIADRLAAIYMRQNKIDDAITIYKNMLSLAKTPEQRLVVQAGLAAASYQQGDKQQALDQLNAMRRQNPDSVIPVLALARLHARQQQWDEFIALSDQWHTSHSDDIDALRLFNRELLASPDKKPRAKALEYLDIITQKDPQDQQSAMYMAMLIHSSGDIERAAKYYRGILEKQPDNTVAMNNLAWILSEQAQAYNDPARRQQQLQEALTFAERGLSISPNYLDLLDTRGMILYDLERYDQAHADFKRCVEEYANDAPGRIGSLYHLGRVLVKKLNQTETGKRYLREALSADEAFMNSPDNPLKPADIQQIQDLLK